MNTQQRGWSVVADEAQLEELVGTPIKRVAEKVRPVLHTVDRQWLAASPFCLVATGSADGRCDVSPKGDPPGFVHVLDDRTIAIPDRPGNRRVDGFRNVLQNPEVGLLFLIPGRADTLRINGAAQLLHDAPFFDEMVVADHRPKLVLLVDVREVFFHCAKAFMRSSLWDAQTWAPDTLPSVARITKAVMEVDESVEQLEQYYGPSYADRLYRG